MDVCCCCWALGQATYNPAPTAKVKGYLHWVSGSSAGAEPRSATVRLFKPLFNDAMDVLDGSLEVVSKAFVDDSLAGVEPFARLQFERVSGSWRRCRPPLCSRFCFS